jgi:purine-binding chemotaxis protein CheW
MEMRNQDTDNFLVFMVGEFRHAVSLLVVEKVELAVEVTPFPEAPPAVIGVINRRGQILPVLSMRRRLHLPDRKVAASDRIIVVQSPRRRLALLVDEVVGVRPAERSDFTSAESISDGRGCVAGAVRTEDGIVLIHDLELFLTEEEEKTLDTR